MTDSLKLTELHRTNIEYERQRHLANWFIKSSPHMAKPVLQQTVSNSVSTSSALINSPNKSQTKSNQNKNNTTINNSQNGLFFLSKSHQLQPPLPNNHPPPNSATAAAVIQQQLNAAGNIVNTNNLTNNNVNNLAMSRSSALFNSQNNLPLQIITQSQEGHKPKLRRFNSHDTSANMFSVADFENARLARRNEMELKQRQQQQQQHHQYKINTLSSGGGDCSTGDSKGSKFSNDSHTAELLPAELFLDRFSLPRVVRISTGKPPMKFGGDETIQSSSSNGSSSAGSTSIGSKKKDMTMAVNINANNKPNGELFLLFRHLKNRRIFHGLNTKNGASRKKGVMIPQEFQGYFSLVNEKGASTATMYTTLVQLVRERVYRFLSVDNLVAYTETTNTDTFPPRPHYVRGTARGGQIFRLLAVFEDGKHESNSSTAASAAASLTNVMGSKLNSSNSSAGFREKEKGRYAQLLNENRQVIYVSLTSKGKFYEIEQTTPQIFQKTNHHFNGNGGHDSSSSLNITPKPFNTDCVHRINDIVGPKSTLNAELPITLRYITASSNGGNTSGGSTTSSLIPENITITKVTTENVIIVCPIDDVEIRSPLHLRKFNVTPDMQCIKSLLGYDSEQKMFLSQNIQNVIKFCQINVDNFLRMIEVEQLTGLLMNNNGKSKPDQRHSGNGDNGNSGGGGGGGGGGLKILKPLNFPRRLLRRDKSIIAHEKEDSIIFLSKNDLENMEGKSSMATTKSAITRQDTIAASDRSVSASSGVEKMKVFQPSTKKKWFRHLTTSNSNKLNSSFSSVDVDVQSKRMSMDRYQDMSKLLQERFGGGNEASETLVIGQNNKQQQQQQQSSSVGAASVDYHPNSQLTNLREIKSAEYNNRALLETSSTDELAILRQKSLSMQDMYTSTGRSNNSNRSSGIYSSKPDLVRVDLNIIDGVQQKKSTNSNDIDTDTSLSSFTNNQQSFITEKLFNEFHVKTKHHSKSSSHLHNLLHFSVPSKMNLIETKKQKSESEQHHIEVQIENIPLQTNGNENNTTITSFDDDLPYSSVRDSLVIDDDASNPNDSSSSTVTKLSPATATTITTMMNRSLPKHTFQNGQQHQQQQQQPPQQSHHHHHQLQLHQQNDGNFENIYSEICSETSSHGTIVTNTNTTNEQWNNQIVRSNSNGNSAIRITVMGSESIPSSANSVTVAVEDNIYNTIK